MYWTHLTCVDLLGAGTSYPRTVPTSPINLHGGSHMGPFTDARWLVRALPYPLRHMGVDATAKIAAVDRKGPIDVYHLFLTR